MKLLRANALLLLFFTLVACHSGPPPTLEERVGAYQWRAVTEADSYFVMPAGATDLVVGSWRKSWDNAIEQRSSLRSDSVIPGESYLSLRFIGRPLDVTELFSLGQSLSPTRYTDRTIPYRLREEFPGLATEIVREPRRNRYGSYYYATARHGDQRCVLAWQVLDRDSGTLPVQLRRLEMEYRYCGGDDPSADELLYPFDVGVVRPDTGVLPLGGLSMPAASPSVQGPGTAPRGSAAATTGGSNFPRPAGAAPASSSSAASGATTPVPRPLFNGRQAQSQGTSAPASGGFPMPGGR